jgi:hypothetical protein
MYYFVKVSLAFYSSKRAAMSFRQRLYARLTRQYEIKKACNAASKFTLLQSTILTLHFHLRFLVMVKRTPVPPSAYAKPLQYVQLSSTNFSSWSTLRFKILVTSEPITVHFQPIASTPTVDFALATAFTINS